MVCKFMPKVIVSFTTHSVRVKNVARTIFSIFRGTFKDIQIVMTLYKDDVKLITPDLQLLIDNGVVELLIADKDLGPHLKYFYAMQKYRGLPVITIDDDILYPENMVEVLYKNYLTNKGCIIARRSFYITKTNGVLDSYHVWLKHFTGLVLTPTHKIFATGIGGILYPADCFELSDDNVAEILSIKYDDDFYLKALEVRKGLKVVNVCASWGELYLKNLTDTETQSIALWYNKNKVASDKNIAKYRTEFMYAAG